MWIVECRHAPEETDQVTEVVPDDNVPSVPCDKRLQRSGVVREITDHWLTSLAQNRKSVLRQELPVVAAPQIDVRSVLRLYCEQDLLER